MSTHAVAAWQNPIWTPTWTLQVVVASTFFATGAIKLVGADFMVDLFAQIGMGQWLRGVTGVVEIVGAFAIVYPGLASIGGLWLSTTMIVAALTDVFVLHSSPTFAVLLGVLNAIIVFLHRDEVAAYARLVTEAP